MLFSSFAFLFAFLPATWLGYEAFRALRPRLGIIWLTLASVAFYAYWRSDGLLVLVASIGVNFLIGRHLARLGESAAQVRRGWLWLGIGLNLAALGWFKYAGFLVGTAAALLGGAGPVLDVALPVGISFYTFTQIAFLVDSYRRQGVEYDPLRYVLFVTFFPHLIAGPIIHHREMMPQFARTVADTPSRRLLVGLTVFIVGLFKKVVVADGIAHVADGLFNATALGYPPGFAEAWAGALAYAFQIYFDFSGYSDMAIGLAWMFGIRLPVNFASPYKATSIIEFWQRWHVTLSRFLRDYLYIALGGNRRGETRRYANLLVTMLLGGLWHGAGWTFVLWGGLHGAFLAVNHLWRAAAARRGWSLWAGPARLVTFAAVVAAWVPFRAANLSVAWQVWRAMAGMRATVGVGADAAAAAALAADSLQIKGLSGVTGLPVLLAIVWALPNTHQWLGRASPGLATAGYPATALQPAPFVLAWRQNAATAVALALIFCLCVLQLDDLSEFIYFQF